jgi:hypothetical protein
MYALHIHVSHLPNWEHTQRYSFIEDEVIIGRGLHCNVCLPYPWISTQHLRIIWNRNQCKVWNLYSKNESYIGVDRLDAQQVYITYDQVFTIRILQLELQCSIYPLRSVPTDLYDQQKHLWQLWQQSSGWILSWIPSPRLQSLHQMSSCIPQIYNTQNHKRNEQQRMIPLLLNLCTKDRTVNNLHDSQSFKEDVIPITNQITLSHHKLYQSLYALCYFIPIGSIINITHEDNVPVSTIDQVSTTLSQHFSQNHSSQNYSLQQELITQCRLFDHLLYQCIKSHDKKHKVALGTAWDKEKHSIMLHSQQDGMKMISKSLIDSSHTNSMHVDRVLTLCFHYPWKYGTWVVARDPQEIPYVHASSWQHYWSKFKHYFFQ